MAPPLSVLGADDDLLAGSDEYPENDETGAETGDTIAGAGALASLDMPGAKDAIQRLIHSSQQARSALAQAREKIGARKYNKGIALLAVSGALGQPTRSGAASEGWANAANALIGPVREKAQFEAGQDKELLGIDTQMAGLDQNTAQAELQLAALRAKLANTSANSANNIIVGEDGVPRYATRQDARGKKAYTTPPTQLTVDQRGETEQSKTINKFYGDDFADMQKAGRTAPVEIADYRRMGDLLEGIQTGKLTPAIADLQSIAESFGVKLNPKLGAIQAAEAISKGLALKLRNPAEGGGMPGSLSNSDRDYLKAMVPGASTSSEGRKLMIDAAIKLKQRDQEIAKLSRDYLAKHGKMDGGFYDELQAWSDQHPLFDTPASGAPIGAAAPARPDAGETSEPPAAQVPAGITRSQPAGAQTQRPVPEQWAVDPANPPMRAPPEREKYLRDHPETAQQFLDHYQYLPPGFN